MRFPFDSGNKVVNRQNRLRSVLVKSYCMAIAALFLLSLLLCVFGQIVAGFTLFTTSFPWLVRLAVIIICILSISALKESI
jgi:hypothetical protein